MELCTALLQEQRKARKLKTSLLALDSKGEIKAQLEVPYMPMQEMGMGVPTKCYENGLSDMLTDGGFSTNNPEPIGIWHANELVPAAVERLPKKHQVAIRETFACIDVWCYIIIYHY